MKEITLYDGSRYIPVVFFPPSISLAYALTGLRSETLVNVSRCRSAPEGTNTLEALRAVEAEIERRRAAATLFDRALTAAREAKVRRHFTGPAIEPEVIA